MFWSTRTRHVFGTYKICFGASKQGLFFVLQDMFLEHQTKICFWYLQDNVSEHQTMVCFWYLQDIFGAPNQDMFLAPTRYVLAHQIKICFGAPNQDMVLYLQDMFWSTKPIYFFGTYVMCFGAPNRDMFLAPTKYVLKHQTEI